ncbi:MAG: peptidylprolyl isomerase [Candidatus Dojkabacteria bacterium]
MSAVGDAVKDNKKILLLVVGLLVVSVVGLYMTRNGMNTNITDDVLKTKTFSAAKNVMEDGVDYRAIIKTSFGNIEIDLFEKETPLAVNNFLFLAGERFYEGVIFHRVVEGFVIQGGDPKGTGSGGPGYTFNDEETERQYKPYSLGMANAGANTNGSQFFITLGDISEGNLAALNNGVYTLFGEVTKGFAVVDSIGRVETDSNDKPINSVTIDSIQILEN